MNLNSNQEKRCRLYTLAIENSNSGLPLFDTIFLLGRDVAVVRINKALAVF
jgi:hypothetical protein